jgi:hypothetical protein
MTEEHKSFLRSKCSRRKTVDMPEFPQQNLAKTPGGAHETNSHTVTPVPQHGLPLKNASTATAGGASEVTPFDTKPKEKPAQKPSKAVLEMHKKWQEQAETMGGKGARQRIVVKKEDAKVLINGLLHDAFRPMNITQIHAVRKFWCKSSTQSLVAFPFSLVPLKHRN